MQTSDSIAAAPQSANTGTPTERAKWRTAGVLVLIALGFFAAIIFHHWRA